MKDLIVTVYRAKMFQTVVGPNRKKIFTRKVTIPGEEVGDPDNIENILDLVFRYGQNEHQPQTVPSVSVGDIIHYQGRRWRIEMVGFQELRIIRSEAEAHL